MTVGFSIMTSFEHQEDVVAMMRLLYEEDEAASAVDYSQFPSSVKHLVSSPSAGEVILFSEGRALRGYSLLIPYWSNEFGGTLLFIDELFVMPGFRDRGIGRSFFRYLEQRRPFEAVALALEVSPQNSRGTRLYESLGFVRRRNHTLTRSSHWHRLIPSAQGESNVPVL